MDIELVPMTVEHLDAVMTYEPEMFGPESWSRASYVEELRDQQRRHYIAAVADGELIGWAGVMVVSDTAEILTVGTIPAARRRGVARALVTAVLAEASHRGATQVFLEVRGDNDAARRLYEEFGFLPSRIRRGYYQARQGSGRDDALEMRRDLAGQ